MLHLLCMLALTAVYTGQRYVQTQTGILWAILMMLSELMLTMLRLTAWLRSLRLAAKIDAFTHTIPPHMGIFFSGG